MMNWQNSQADRRRGDPTSLRNQTGLDGQLGAVIRTFGLLRRKFGLEAEELLIYLAAGFIGSNVISDTVTTERPVSFAEIVQLVGIPRETVRRKALKLEKSSHLTVTTSGVLIRDLDQLRSIASRLAGQS
jgi:ribosomal protein S14